MSLHAEAARAIGWERRAVGLGLPASEPGGGLLTGGLACYRCYPTADGRALAVAALEPHFFERLCQLLGRLDLAPQHLDPAVQPRLEAELAATFAARPLAHWQGLLDGEDVACAPVMTVTEALAFAPDASSALAPARASPAPDEILAELCPLHADERRQLRRLGTRLPSRSGWRSSRSSRIPRRPAA